MIPIDFITAHSEVIKLAKTFADSHDKYLAPAYNESAARKDFIDKFFIALGWDVNHDEQTNPYEQEVKVERNVAARVKKADYAFFLKPDFQAERFFVEAKRPSAPLDTLDSCFQTIRYAFSSSRCRLSILTNFKELYIMDCRFRPDKDTAVNQIHKKYHFEDFNDREKFAEIYYLFGREAVADGSLEKYAETLPKPKGKGQQRKFRTDTFQDIDDAFLAKLEEYRNELAKMFKRKNEQLTSDDLTEAVQRTLDRLVFIRFLEDKLIEPTTILDKFGDKPHPWKQFIAKSRGFDKTYNGIIFKLHPIIDSPGFVVDDKVFLNVCNDFADKYTPYHFNYIPIHILGSIYERFLGNVIVATAKQARIEAKPEVRKAGGVFYTPQYIVNYIVENTVGSLLLGVPPSGGPPVSEKPAKAGTQNAVTPADVAKMRFADIACGSGSFLLGVFEYLLRWHTTYYNQPNNKKEAREDGCLVSQDGTFHLSFEQKKKILVGNVYGVDIDRQAYEVTQLSLFLKLLEEETLGSVQPMLTGHREALLPSLANNIVCGNALVGTDITGGDLFEQLDHDKEKKLNPMDFERRFPTIVANGGFDAIVGNPPYGADLTELSRNYLENKFKLGNTDTACLFMAKARRLTNKTGRIGYIVPKPLIYASNWKKTRDFLLPELLEIVDCGKVWKNVKLEMVVYRSSNDGNLQSYVSAVRTKDNHIEQLGEIQKEMVEQFNLLLNGVSEEEVALGSKIKSIGTNMNDAVTNRRGCMLNSFIKETGEVSVLGGKQIGRYGIETTRVKGFIDRVNLTDEKAFLADGSILVQNIVAHIENPNPHIKIMASIAEMANKDDFIILDTVNQLRNLTNCRPQYILGVINSKLTSWYVYRFVFGKAIRTMHFDSNTTGIIPFPLIDLTNANEKARHDLIVRWVEEIMKAKAKLTEARNDSDVEFWTNKCEKLESDINTAVYSLFGLTPDEIKLIEAITI